ncbi:transcription factor HES-4-B-like [Arapaima gigas]
MPADNMMEKPTASPVAGAPASGSHTPDKPKNASEHRKSSKPIMEKRRRARINESLGQLKTLILDALKKDSSRHSKLEKADILEMTVKHLRNLQRVQMSGALASDTAVLNKYRAGFSECMNEVTRFLSGCEGVNTEVRTRLLSHLSGCMGQMMALNYPQPSPAHQHQHQHPHVAQPLHVQLPPAVPVGGVSVPCKASPSEAASPKVYGGFQLVHAPDGQLAFLIPNPAFASASTPLIPLYAHAVNGSPTRSGSVPAGTPPVQGMTSFPGGAKAGSRTAVSAESDSGEAVWRPCKNTVNRTGSSGDFARASPLAACGHRRRARVNLTERLVRRPGRENPANQTARGRARGQSVIPPLAEQLSRGEEAHARPVSACRVTEPHEPASKLIRTVEDEAMNLFIKVPLPDSGSRFTSSKSLQFQGVRRVCLGLQNELRSSGESKDPFTVSFVTQ